MTTQLPSSLTVDAVPEKRAPDENNQPSTEQETREWLEYQERVRNQTPTGPDGEGDERSEDTCNGVGNRTNGDNCASGPSDGSASGEGKKKERDKEKKKKKYKNVMKIENSVVQFGNTYHINNNIRMKKFPSGFHQPDSTTGKDTPSLPTKISEKVLRCNESVTQDDCSIVSEYITCNWKTLGERLFFQEMDLLKDYIAHVESESKQAATCTILNRWRQINGSAATVQRLSKILQQLGQITAIVKLANRHNIK